MADGRCRCRWRRARGLPIGQVANLRRTRCDGMAEHARVYPDGTATVHVDIADPADAPVLHLVLDVVPWVLRGARDRGRPMTGEELEDVLAVARG